MPDTSNQLPVDDTFREDISADEWASARKAHTELGELIRSTSGDVVAAASKEIDAHQATLGGL